MNTNVNYAVAYFKYPVPTSINGKPTSKSLKSLKTELRANTSSVNIDLGGGYHGYLGLALTDTEYARINLISTAFAVPTFPCVITSDTTVTAVETLHDKVNHHEAMRVYREYNNVEKSLLRHTQNTVESKYMKHLINEDTGLIEDDLPSVLQYLFTRYIKVPSEKAKQR